jgi:copper/silver efflux system protein
MLGLLPALWSHGTGAEVMQRIAAPMIGGMVTSTVLTLVVIPELYYLWRQRGLEESGPVRHTPARKWQSNR